jgi:probable lipoprotein NlpC
MFLFKRPEIFILILFISACSTSKPVATSKKPAYKPGKKTEHVGVATNSKVPPKINKVIETARSYTGTPYKWGGTTRAGMDCSGLVCVSYQAAGVPIPRTSAELSRYGKVSSLESLREGDLVFFAANKGNGKITHVGLITEVKGKNDVKFIHASTKLGVVENNLYSDYYRKIYVKARRPL